MRVDAVEGRVPRGRAPEQVRHVVLTNDASRAGREAPNGPVSDDVSAMEAGQAGPERVDEGGNVQTFATVVQNERPGSRRDGVVPPG
jgi:hypothetical protein